MSRKTALVRVLLDGMWEPFRYIAQLERRGQEERRAERMRRQAYRLRLAEINFQIDRARRFIQEHRLRESAPEGRGSESRGASK